MLLIFILGFNLHFPLFPASKLITTLYFIQTRSIIRFKHYSWTPSKQLRKKKAIEHKVTNQPGECLKSESMDKIIRCMFGTLTLRHNRQDIKNL